MLFLFLLFTAAVLLVVVVPTLLRGVANAKADATYAEAAKLQAQVGVIEARAERDLVRQEAWERRFAMWTVALAAFQQDALMQVLLVALAIGVGVLGVQWLQHKPL